MQLLRPLLLDIVPTVQQTAALALGKLANHNDDLAEAVVKGDILPQLVYSLAEQNVNPKIIMCNIHVFTNILYRDFIKKLQHLFYELLQNILLS